MSTTERGANTCMILLKWKLSLISIAQLYKSILNDDKEKPCKKHMEIQKTRVVSLLHSNQVYILIPRGLFTRNTNAFPGFNLPLHHWKFIFYIVTRTAQFASYLDSDC